MFSHPIKLKQEKCILSWFIKTTKITSASVCFLCENEYTFFLNKNQKLSDEAGLFLIFWRFQPQIVLKLFLFPDISKQWVSCPEQ